MLMHSRTTSSALACHQMGHDRKHATDAESVHVIAPGSGGGIALAALNFKTARHVCIGVVLVGMH